MLPWMVNCGSRKTSAVKLVIEAIGLHMAHYPPNMTAILQVLDLVVNGLLKVLKLERLQQLSKSLKFFKN
jgi:hypothetical protein